jgi:hypothetical protein
MRQVMALGFLVMALVGACTNEGGGPAAEPLGGYPSDPPGGAAGGPLGGPAGGSLDGFFLGPGENSELLFTPEGDFALGSSAEVNKKWWYLDLATADWRGKWRLNGQELLLAFEDRSRPDIRGRVLGADKIEIPDSKGVATVYQRPTKVGRNLTGRFKMTTQSVYGTDDTGHSSGYVNGDHFLTFTGNSVELFDSVGVFINGEYLVSEKAMRGDYVIEGYDMTIAETTGAKSLHSFWVVEWAGSVPSQVAFDRTVYIR